MSRPDRLVEVCRTPDGAVADAKGVDGSGAAGQLLAGFLVLDLQGSAGAAAEVLARLAAVSRGELPGWRRDGNAFTLKLYPDHAVLEDQYPDSKGPTQATIGLAALEDAARQWAQALDPRQ